MTTELNELKERLLALGKEASLCPIERVRNEVDEESAEILNSLLVNPSIPHAAIHRALRASGVSIAKDSIANHRKGYCPCKKES